MESENIGTSAIDDTFYPTKGMCIVAILLLFAVLAVNAASVLGYRPFESASGPAPKREDATTQLQIEQVKLQQKIEAEIWDMRKTIVKSCVDRGGIPFLSGNNIDCKR